MEDQSFDNFSMFTAKPLCRFKMPFLLVTEVLKGESTYFSEYFTGFRNLDGELLMKRIVVKPKELFADIDPSDFGIAIPGFLATQAKAYGLCDLQNELDTKLDKEAPEKYYGIEIEKVANNIVTQLSNARMLISQENIESIEKNTSSQSLKKFLEQLKQLPDLEPEPFNT